VALSRLKLGFESRWGQRRGTRAWRICSAGLVVFGVLGAGCQSTAERQVEAGNVAAAAGAWPEALSAYRAASEARPSDARIKSLVGIAAAATDAPAQAARAWSEALSLDPGTSEARLGLAQLAVTAADAGAALSLLEPETSPTARQLRARTLLLRGAPADAEAALTEARAVALADPSAPEAHYLAGSALLVLSRFAEAQTAFEAAERIAPRSALGPYGLARLAAIQRRETDTVLYLKTARTRLGRAWRADAVSRDPAFAFLAGSPGFTELVGP
jgi:tetratricopeptide (TPR) repeat protein